tara:strand:+ start:1611 stop:1931 length:321 start_codon:yes stop_codon:yes gene_type:complete
MNKKFYLIVSLFLIGCGNSNEPGNNQMDNLPSDCKIFLEDFTAEVTNYISVQKQIEEIGDDINLIIARNSAEQTISEMQSDPALFKCVSNAIFQKSLDSLNNLLDN